MKRGAFGSEASAGRRRVLRMLAAAGASTAALRALASSCMSAGPCTGATAAAGRRVLRVGQEHELRSSAAAAAAVRDGDIVEFEPGIYSADPAIWRANDLTLRARAGVAHMRADGAHAEGKAIWVVKGERTTVEGVTFSGCRVPHGNGAGIRQEGAGLVLRDCAFTDNENGILTGANPGSDILIERCEFGRNGRGDGYTHNIYVGGVRSLTVRYCHLHRAVEGHCLKSRATRTVVAYNQIADELEGRSSYEAEFPNGGLALMVGNLVQQGPLARNFTLVSYGVEGLTHPLNELHAAHNTLVNDRTGGGRFFFVAAGTRIARLLNNVFVGKARVVDGTVEDSGSRTLTHWDLVSPATGDYRPKSDVPNLQARVLAGHAHGLRLAPEFEYVHPRSFRSRAPSEHPAVGAFATAPARPGR
jgi:hypothetical protein